MKLTLKRIAKKPKYTIGKLYIDNTYFCDTLEDTDRGLNSNMGAVAIQSKKVPGETAIPIGTYKVDMNTVSPRFQNTSWAKKWRGIVPRLIDVPGYMGVLMHPGNTERDTSGCILVGQNKQVGRVINSQATWHSLMEKLTREKSQITITIE